MGADVEEHVCLCVCVCFSAAVKEQRLHPVGVLADHTARDRLGEGHGLCDWRGPAAHHLPHGALLQHVRASQRTL